MLLLILGTTSHANNNPLKEWLLPEVATKILRESDYGLTVGGGTGNIGTSKMAEKELGYRSSISFVESEKGFISKKLVKVDYWMETLHAPAWATKIPFGFLITGNINRPLKGL